ncbi:PP2C family protein-serine/threonine phosphatase [Gordonia sp. NPDC062954]|uniref:PP2C family protein-serine/threonine phosphatase n=1 Tax=Gordonia sp. NPDC062954 TaxID=3364003 RepID=UPI0037C9B048
MIAVIDGMGGQPGGDLAAWTASRRLGELRLGNATSPDEVGEAIQQLSDHVLEVGRATEGHALMGAVIAGLVCADTGLFLFNVGDCSILRTSGDYVGELAEIDSAGEHAVGQCLGGTEHPVAIDAHPIAYTPAQPERLILCSDGLTRCVDTAQIGDLAGELDGPDLVRALIAAATRAGAPDNVTIAVVDIDLDEQ